MLTKDEALKLLQQAVDMEGTDPEASHSMADDALCGYLEYRGDTDLVELWNKVSKWYA